MKVKRGKCRYCGCTDRRACTPPCSWLDDAHTICNAVLCAERAIKDGLAIRMRFGGRGGSLIVARA